MKRSIPWALAAIFFVSFAASFAELQRLRVRFGEVTTPAHFHVHFDVRRSIIHRQLERTKNQIVVVGDSIVEGALFDAFLCGRPVINAGIGGATASDFKSVAKDLFGDASPSLIVVALGMNDALGKRPAFIDDMRTLTTSLRGVSPNVIVSGITNVEPGSLVSDSAGTNRYIESENAKLSDLMHSVKLRFSPQPPLNGETIDGVHLSSRGYERWQSAMFGQIATALGCS